MDITRYLPVSSNTRNDSERPYCLLRSKQWAMMSVNDKNCFALSCDTKHVLRRHVLLCKTLILRRILRCDTAYRKHWPVRGLGLQTQQPQHLDDVARGVAVRS